MHIQPTSTSTHCQRRQAVLSRREALAQAGSGLGAIALGALLARDGALAAPPLHNTATTTINPLAPRSPHFPAKAQRVISLFMQGGPAQMDSFDPKPELARLDGQPLPASFQSADLKLQFMSAAGANLMTSGGSIAIASTHNGSSSQM